MLPKIFRPEHGYDLIRLGGDYDGGYLVEKNSVESSESLITLGLGYEWTFEKDYYKKYKKPITCYDHTVNYSSVKKVSRQALIRGICNFFKPKYFLKKNFFSNFIKNIFLYKDYKNLFCNEVQHHVVRVGPGTGPGNKNINFSEIIKKNNKLPCYLKVDIEASEYRILDEILNTQNKFMGIAIEFHDVDLHLDKIQMFIKSLDMTLVHIHPMNQALEVNGIPIQIELTFSKNPKKISEEPQIPHRLDMAGNPTFENIELKFK